MSGLEPPRPRARPAFVVVAITGSFLLSALALEGSLRVYHLVRDRLYLRDLPPIRERALVPSEDAELLCELNPGFREPDFSVNSLGMADREIQVAKPAGVYRIAFVGDSITCGFRLLPREALYGNVVAETLNARSGRHYKYESLNFGVNGYGILQDLRVASTRILPFEPDVVVVQFCLNDPYSNVAVYGDLAPQPRFRTGAFLFRVLRPDRFWGYMWVERNYDPRGIAQLKRGIDGIAALSSIGRPKVLAVLFPYLHAPAYRSWDFERYHRLFREEAAATNLPLLDLFDAFQQEGLIDDAWPKDALHPDPRGHRLAADAIVRELRSRGWVAEERERADGSR